MTHRSADGVFLMFLVKFVLMNLHTVMLGITRFLESILMEDIGETKIKITMLMTK
jgi:hypothetical protein